MGALAGVFSVSVRVRDGRVRLVNELGEELDAGEAVAAAVTAAVMAGVPPWLAWAYVTGARLDDDTFFTVYSRLEKANVYVVFSIGRSVVQSDIYNLPRVLALMEKHGAALYEAGLRDHHIVGVIKPAEDDFMLELRPVHCRGSLAVFIVFDSRELEISDAFVAVDRPFSAVVGLARDWAAIRGALRKIAEEGCKIHDAAIIAAWNKYRAVISEALREYSEPQREE